MSHVMTIRAFPLKAECGGGFRGQVHLHPSGEKLIADFPAYEQARFWAQSEGHKRMAGKPYAKGALRQPKQRYYVNIWVEGGAS